MGGEQDTIRKRDMMGEGWGEKMFVRVGGSDTHETFNDMLPVLFPSLSLASVIHKGLHVPEGHGYHLWRWSMEEGYCLYSPSLTNSEVGLWGYSDSCCYDPVSGGNRGVQGATVA